MKIFEPSRDIYRKRTSRIKICEFCNLKNIKKQECKSLSGKYWRVLVNLYPYMDGNLMLIPKRHIIDTNELNNNEKAEFFEVLEKTKNKLGKTFKTKDFNIGLNLGKNAGASIEHLHWQIIPRKFKIENASNIFADIQIMTMLPGELKKNIDKKS